MHQKLKSCICLLILTFFGQMSSAEDLTISTVTRSPFSLVENGNETGFSLDLFAEVAKDLNWTYEIKRFDDFPSMLDAVTNGEADAAIANISITARRETVMDFSQPIFAAGLQIMTNSDTDRMTSWKSIISKEVVLFIVLAFGLLQGFGMLMWRLERKHQDYFDLSAKEAVFPAFWWALNLILNGSFEERQPRSPLGRLLGVALVISSLFFVSVFVAQITTMMTVQAIQSNVSQLSDLYDKRVGTIEKSTAAEFLNKRDLRHTGYADVTEMFADFESGTIDAIVFDAPILSHYVKTNGGSGAHIVGKVFLPENYGIALQSGSKLAEPINQSLLELRENGVYDRIYNHWFGAN